MLISQLEEIDVDSPQFVRTLTVLRDMVIRHAVAEERMEFTYLQAPLDASQRERLARLSVLAASVAPSSSRLDYPTVTEAALSGPFSAVVERIREFLVSAETAR